MPLNQYDPKYIVNTFVILLFVCSLLLAPGAATRHHPNRLFFNGGDYKRNKIINSFSKIKNNLYE